MKTFRNNVRNSNVFGDACILKEFGEHAFEKYSLNEVRGKLCLREQV